MLPRCKQTIWNMRLKFIKLLRKLGLRPMCFIDLVRHCSPLSPMRLLLLETPRRRSNSTGVLIERICVWSFISVSSKTPALNRRFVSRSGHDIKAVNTSIQPKIKLATYASCCIENEILMYSRRNNKTRANFI